MDSKKKKEAPDRYSGIRALYEVGGKDGPKTKQVGKGRGERLTRSRTLREVERRGSRNERKDREHLRSKSCEKVYARSMVITIARERTRRRSKREKDTRISEKNSRASSGRHMGSSQS